VPRDFRCGRLSDRQIRRDQVRKLSDRPGLGGGAVPDHASEGHDRDQDSEHEKSSDQPQRLAWQPVGSAGLESGRRSQPVHFFREYPTSGLNMPPAKGRLAGRRRAGREA